MTIDINYDFRIDLKYNEDDVDKYSSTLKNYHKILWQKTLPNGMYFNLFDNVKDEYLLYKINLNEIRLSSDWIINTYLHWNWCPEINNFKGQIKKEDYNEFTKIAHTIGSYIISPKYPINTPRNKQTINQKRGKDVQIGDRFDLTLECIRKYYLNEESPLYSTLTDFDYYFQLFIDFKGFCDFYLLQDLTIDNYSKIKYFLTFNGFEMNPYPKTVGDYYEYMKNTTEFINNRNNRISCYIKNNL
jgi:hypothetical protein